MDFKILILQFLNTNDSTINVLDQEQITVMELLFKGGFMMIPILILFVITIYILIEKILIINRESKSPKGFTDEIISRVKNDDINGAKLICNDTNNPVSRMILKGLNKFNTSLKNIETSIENVGKIEIYNLEKNLSLLATISGAAPMIGFLGTVTGMIITFQQITLFGTGDPKIMAGGISQALVTTVLGLVVAIPTTLAHSFLQSSARSVVDVLEEQATGMVAEKAK